LTTNFRMSRALRGRPVLHTELSYFRAANLRNHVKIVPGWMIWQHFRRQARSPAARPTGFRRESRPTSIFGQAVYRDRELPKPRLGPRHHRCPDQRRILDQLVALFLRPILALLLVGCSRR
jgi:hypothetical protein